MRYISWPNTDPAHSLSTLSPERYRSGPKTRYEASGAELPRRSFHPLEIMSFSCRTQILTTRTRVRTKYDLFADDMPNAADTVASLVALLLVAGIEVERLAVIGR